MSQRKWNCPKPGCCRDATFVRFAVELVPMPRSMNRDELKRKPPFGELVRNFIVECPEHGQVYVQTIGHHITTIPKKSGK